MTWKIAFFLSLVINVYLFLALTWMRAAIKQAAREMQAIAEGLKQ